MAQKKSPTKKTAPRKPVAKSAAAKKPTPKTAANTSVFPVVFERLKAILTPYAPRMVTVKDDKTWYYLDTKFTGKNKKPIMFAAVRVGKNYVSFYLMSVYAHPKAQAAMSPELMKRMQGKACFNFAAVDEGLFAELESLTASSSEWFLNGGLEKLLGT
jgi:hypothetical protein